MVVVYEWRSLCRDEMYGRISFQNSSVASVHALWSFLGRSSVGLIIFAQDELFIFYLF